MVEGALDGEPVGRKLKLGVAEGSIVGTFEGRVLGLMEGVTVGVTLSHMSSSLSSDL